MIKTKGHRNIDIGMRYGCVGRAYREKTRLADCVSGAEKDEHGNDMKIENKILPP